MTNLRAWIFLGLGGSSTVAIALYWQHWEFLGGFISLLVVGIGAIVLLNNSTPPISQPLTRHSLLKSLGQVNKVISKISDRPIQVNLESIANQIAADLDQNQFRIAVLGTIGSGKTSIINALLQQNIGQQAQNPSDRPAMRQLQSIVKRKISLIDSPGLQNHGKLGLIQETEALTAAQSADLLLFVTSGDLGAIEYQALVDLAESGKRIILVFNKIDRYLPTDRDVIEIELKRKTSEFLLSNDVVSIAAAPTPITVRQYENCDRDRPKLVKEWLEPLPPDIEPLKAKIESILSHEWEELLLSNTSYKLQQLHKLAQASLQKIRHERGHKIITRYQWLNAGIIFANPIPAVDLIASVAIGAKLFMELSQVYDRQLDLKQAQKMAGATIEILIKLGCVEVATVAIANQASYFLKTNVVTFAIGGTVQAVSAAYLTHVAGVSFLDYLDRASEPDFTINNMLDRMIDVCGANFAKVKDMGFIQDFVDRTISNLVAS
jgi:uncharacterized protein